MRTLILIAGAALTLSACNRNDPNTADANALAEDNMLVEGGETGAGGIDANTDTNAAVEDAKLEDLTTNDADTNLANGM